MKKVKNLEKIFKSRLSLIINFKNLLNYYLVNFHGIKSFIFDKKITINKKLELRINKINKFLILNKKKIINLRSNAFGFSLMQIDYLFKYIKSNQINSSDLILISPKINNSFLKKILKSKLKLNLLEFKNIYNLLISLFPKKKYFGANFIITPADCGNYDYPSDLKITFSSDECKFGDDLLEKLGVDKSDKVIVISYKSASYFSDLFKESTNFGLHEKNQKYRISDHKKLNKTLNFLKSRNYVPIIFNFLNEEEELYFSNYPRIHSIKDKKDRDFLEFYSHYKSQFSLCGNSGDQFIPKLFGKKTLFHNGTIPHSLSSGIFLPKKFIDKNTGKQLNLTQVLSRKIFYYEKSDTNRIKKVSPIYFRDIVHFEKKGIKVLENSEDEILNATKELIILSEKNKLNLNDEQIILQNQIKKIYFNNFYKTDYTMPAKKISGYVSPSFLQSNKEFLDNL